VLTLSGRSGRGWRTLTAILWVPGVWAVIASYRGMCICMYTLSKYLGPRLCTSTKFKAFSILKAVIL
jgi:hypothetical protein